MSAQKTSSLLSGFHSFCYHKASQVQQSILTMHRDEKVQEKAFLRGREKKYNHYCLIQTTHSVAKESFVFVSNSCPSLKKWRKISSLFFQILLCFCSAHKACILSHYLKNAQHENVLLLHPVFIHTKLFVQHSIGDAMRC